MVLTCWPDWPPLQNVIYWTSMYKFVTDLITNYYKPYKPVTDLNYKLCYWPHYKLLPNLLLTSLQNHYKPVTDLITNYYKLLQTCTDLITNYYKLLQTCYWPYYKTITDLLLTSLQNHYKPVTDLITKLLQTVNWPVTDLITNYYKLLQTCYWPYYKTNYYKLLQTVTNLLLTLLQN
jgi:hypothetical protein